MVTTVVFLLALFGLASPSHLPHNRTCELEPGRETPTVCSNYKNILHIDDGQTKLEEKLMMLEQRIDTLEGTQQRRFPPRAKVAFSAATVESPDVFTGPAASTNTTLIFGQVFTNIGNAYNKNTGIFTAPTKGVYHFTFVTFGYNRHNSGAILMKNGQYQMSTWEFTGLDMSDTTSNTIILELNTGDTVNINLWQGGKIHTGAFSGFLIFPLYWWWDN